MNIDTTHTTADASSTRPDQPLQLVLRRAELAAQIQRLTQQEGSSSTIVPGLFLARASRVNEPVHAVHEPAFCVMAQGSKRVLLGEELYVYDSVNYLVVSQNLPVTGQVFDATPESPYLALRLNLDLATIAQLMVDVPVAPPRVARESARGIFTGEITIELLDALIRLTRLLDTPDDAKALSPLIVREILYRLLKGEQGWRLGQLAIADSQGQRICKAISWLHERFTQSLRVEDMARELHMSVSSLHHHFKAVTAMSPLQYQKQLRLQEARRLLFNASADAATAAFKVGYESPSQFSREYSRMFGAPPARDVRRFRQAAMGGSA